MQVTNTFSNANIFNDFAKSTSRKNQTQDYEKTAGNVFAENTYTITAARVEKVLKEGMIEFIYPQPSNTPFSTALSQKQSAVNEYEYTLAINRIKELMDEISSFVRAEQGEDSELSYYLDTMRIFFAGQNEMNKENLDSIQHLIGTQKDDESIIKAIDSYFMFGANTAGNAMNFFDYISDKIEGLPMDQIMQDLAILKGYWDNNSRENLTLDNGIKVGFVYADEKGNSKAILTISLPNGIKAEFNEINLYDENSKILFEMFQQRENFNQINADKISNSKTNSTHLLQNLLNDLDIENRI